MPALGVPLRVNASVPFSLACVSFTCRCDVGVNVFVVVYSLSFLVGLNSREPSPLTTVGVKASPLDSKAVWQKAVREPIDCRLPGAMERLAVALKRGERVPRDNLLWPWVGNIERGTKRVAGRLCCTMRWPLFL